MSALRAGGATVAGLGAAWYLKQKFTPLAREASLISRGARGVAYVTSLVNQGVFSVLDLFEHNCERWSERVMLIHEGVEYKWKDVRDAVYRTARAALRVGVRCGDCVAILYYNSPEYLWTYLGLMAVGACVALLNYNLIGQQLAHCIASVDARFIFIGPDAELRTAFGEIRDRSELREIRAFGAGPAVPDWLSSFDEQMSRVTSDPVDRRVRAGVNSDTVVNYVYTSGTTGLPKAANITGPRSMVYGVLSKYLIGLNENDINYVVLPMYHTSGMALGVLATILAGNVSVIRKKFSASHFWDDIRRYKCTSFIYIGEICRFLVNQPPSMLDGKHSLRMIYGNGMKKEVWEEMMTRFKVPRVHEFYGATEGNYASVNLSWKVGSIGICSPYLSGRLYKLVKYDVENERAYRNKQGFCELVKTGEPGLMIGEITDRTKFYGYRDQRQSQKKVLRDVFKRGDMYFDTGDIMRKDSECFLFFEDRAGDTFRWRGENVSTQEVSKIMSELKFIADICVYGVRIPGSEGRIGMASIILKDGVNYTDVLQDLYKHVQKTLADYAKPHFVRFSASMPLTGTYKQRKVVLTSEGWDVTKVSDPVYYLNHSEEAYRPVTSDNTQQVIQAMNARHRRKHRL